MASLRELWGGIGPFIVLSTLTVGLTTAHAVTLKGAGLVIALQGEAEVRRASLPAPQLLKFRDDVFWKDVLITRSDSRLRVLLQGRTVVALGPVARMELQEPVEAAAPHKTVVQLLAGLARIAFDRTVELRQEIEVQTPNAVTGIRGTILFVEVQPGPTAATTVTTVAVEQGEVIVTGLGGQQVTVTAGQQAILPGAQPPRLEPVPPGRFEQLEKAVRPPPPPQKGSAVSVSMVQHHVHPTTLRVPTDLLEHGRLVPARDREVEHFILRHVLERRILEGVDRRPRRLRVRSAPLSLKLSRPG